MQRPFVIKKMSVAAIKQPEISTVSHTVKNMVYSIFHYFSAHGVNLFTGDFIFYDSLICFIVCHT